MSIYTAVLLTLGAAVAIAVYGLLIRVGTGGRDGTINDALIVILICNVLFVTPIAYVRNGTSFTLSAVAILSFMAAGIVASTLGRACFYKGIETIGASRSEPLKATQLIYATIIPVVVLGEVLSAPHVLGIVCIMGGVALISLTTSGSAPDVDVRNNKIGLLFALGSGLFYGIEPTFAKVGLNTGAPVFVGLAIKSATALVTFYAYLRLRGYRFSFHSAGLRWFVVAGVANTAFAILYYVALQSAPITVVYPIMQMSPLFVIVLSLAFMPTDLEYITPRLVLGVLVTVAGAVTVTLFAG